MSFLLRFFATAQRPRSSGIAATLVGSCLTCVACDRNVDQQHDAPSRAALSASDCETCVARDDGSVACWGDSIANPTAGPAPHTIALPGEATSVAVGPDHVCALVPDSGIYCWGFNDVGQLGAEIPADPTQPLVEPVKSSLSASSTRITAGDSVTCALSAGVVSCVGGKWSGILGNGDFNQTSVPVAVPGLASVIDVQAGHAFMCALEEAGDVFCWGANVNGESGQALTTNRVDHATRVEGVSGADRIAVGPDIACAHTSSGETWCWGSNQVGLFGGPSDDYGPTKTALGSYDALALGSLHAFGLRSDGGVDHWGVALRLDADLMAEPPSPMAGLDGASSLVAGSRHGCAVVGSEVRCWGDNQCHQLGADGDFSATAIAVVSSKSK